MNVLVILGHPNPASFNHAIAETVVRTLEGEGHRVVFRDLCAEGFDAALPFAEFRKRAPVPPWLGRHCEELQAAEGIVVVHPNWWGQPPAVLKGWIDRVFRPGVAYEFLEGDRGAGVPMGLLRARAALVLNTSNTPPARERAVFGDPLETLWKNCIFGLCGVSNVQRRTFGAMATSTPEERSLWLAEVRELAERCFPG